AEVEGLEALDEGKAGQARAHGDVLGGLGGHFLGEHEVQEVGVGRLLRRGVLQQGLEPLADFEQPQSLQVLLEALELRRAHVPAPLRIRTEDWRSEEHTSELQSRSDLVCRLLLEKKKKKKKHITIITLISKSDKPTIYHI